MSATSYPRSEEDWQGVFIRNIANAVAEENALSLWAPDGPRRSGIRYACTDSDRVWLNALANAGGIAHLLGKNPLRAAAAGSSLLFRLRKAYRRAAADTDIFHINWLQNALPLIGLDHPAVITVLGTDFKLLKLPGMRTALRTVLRQRRAVLAPNADWMCAKLNAEFGDLASVVTVPFGTDEQWYQVERAPSAPHKWIAVLRVTPDKIGPLFDWGASLFSSGDRELHLIGPNQGEMVIPDWVHFHGPASPEVLAAEWFPKAAGLLTLSQHSEGRPQVILEAMAAGLPVLASDIPAHEDFLTNGKTGRLVGNPADFADALSAIEDSAAQLHFSARCRDFAIQNYGTWQDCAARYHSIYESLSS